MYNFKIKTFINEENLLKHVSDYDIFKYYIGDFKIGKSFSSPFRKDDYASFNIGYNSITNKLYYNDYVLGGGNFILFVMYKYNLNYREACNKIVIDLDLQEHFHLYDLDKKIIKENKKFLKSTENEIKKFKKEVYLSAKIRSWQEHDLQFWKQFGITLSTLEKYNVFPAEYAMVGEKIFKLDKYAYVFVEYKDNEKTITVYQPYNNQKWMKNHNSSVWYGWTQLPEKGKNLIITKSRKDIMSIYENTGIPVAGLQNEKILPKQQVMDELKNRFETIYVLYDNDFDKPVNWGREFGQKLSDEYNLFQIEIPEDLESKDFSDLILNHGKKKACEVLYELISDTLPF